MNALPRKGSSCHNVNCSDWKLENTHPDPFNSNTSMKFSSCRLTSSRGGAASAAYTAIISEVNYKRKGGVEGYVMVTSFASR